MESFYRHLRSRKEYENLYDEITVRKCRIIENIFLKEYPHIKMVEFPIKSENRRVSADGIPKDNKFFEKLPKEEQECRTHYCVTRLMLYFETGDRYLKKEETIKEWIKRDEVHDKKRECLWEITHPRENKRCRQCGDKMKSFHKDFHSDGSTKDKDQILFMYECQGCKYREGEFNNGELWKKKPSRCPKCNDIIIESSKHLKTMIKHFSKCPSCDFEDVWEMDLSNKPKKKTSEEIKKENLMERDKLRFCLTVKEGVEYANQRRSLERLNQLSNEIDEQEKNKELYEKAEKVERINIWEVQKRIKATIKGKKFVKLKFEEPNMGQDVTCEFRIYESDPARTEKDSCKILEKLIAKAFKNTNWKLMSDGISCRMGILTGRIRGMEKEEDIFKHVKL